VNLGVKGATVAPPNLPHRILPDSPDLAALHQERPERYPHLLQSVSHGTARARYDILFAFPGTTLALEAGGRLCRDGQEIGPGGFLAAFDDLWRAHAQPSREPGHDTRLPFTGGWFVFFGYELAAEIEPVLGRLPADPALPVACAVRFPAAVIRDHATRRTHLVCEPEAAARLLPQMELDIHRLRAPRRAAVAVEEIAEEDPARFLAGVEKVQEYIRAGDVYQVNLSRLWRARLRRPAPSVELYRRLCAANPAPFAALATFPGDRAILSSSPERLVEVRDGVIRTRPIAGTYPRSREPAQDRAAAQELLRHPKERAEHVMLIDLERNDLGRLCRLGTVQVSELMTLESYPHVHHIVSEIRGALRAETTPAQVLRAVFPGGTITGCPKVRCMQLIAEIERVPRGAYTGSLGYINDDGSMDLNILIRTLVRQGDEIRLRAGAGIVADSIPGRELNETRAKAKGLLAALGAPTP